jgi:hypothetical protein
MLSKLHYTLLISVSEKVIYYMHRQMIFEHNPSYYELNVLRGVRALPHIKE